MPFLAFGGQEIMCFKVDADFLIYLWNYDTVMTSCNTVMNHDSIRLSEIQGDKFWYKFFGTEQMISTVLARV